MEAPEHFRQGEQQVTVVSEFGNWMRRILLFLMCVQIVLSLVTIVRLNDFTHTTANVTVKRSDQICGILAAVKDKSQEAAEAYIMNCGP